MPELCAFDDAPTQFPKLFDDEVKCQVEEGDVAADWFGSLVPSPTNLFGGLNPKQPDSFATTPVGAVFNWDDLKQQDSLLPFDSLYGETDFYNYDISSMEPVSPVAVVRDSQSQELQTVSSKINNVKLVDHVPDVPQVKQEPNLDTLLRLKVEKAEKPEKSKVAKKPTVGEKKKRGRPRLNTGQEPLSPMYVDLDDVNISARALTDHPSNLHSTNDESAVTIGSYCKAVRRAKIARYRAKKLHNLQYGPHLRFAFRKQFAGARPRVGGRFIKLHSDPLLDTPPRADSDSDMLSRDELPTQVKTEEKFFFSNDSNERDALNLSSPNDPYFNDLVTQYAALWRPESHMFVPFPFAMNGPLPAQG